MRAAPEIIRQAGRQYGLLTLAQLRLSYSEDEVRSLVKSGFLERTPFAALYRLVGSPVSTEQRVFAAQLAVPRGLISHRTAIALFGILPWTTEVIHLTAPRGARCRAAGVKVHHKNELPSPHQLGVFRTVDPEQALIDISTAVLPSVLGRAVESAVHQNLVTFASLRSAMVRVAGQGRAGVRPLNELLDAYGFDPDELRSPLEREFRKAIAAAGLPQPVPQFPVRAFEHDYFVDLAYPTQRILIEVDGRDVHAKMLAFDHDAVRRSHLNAAGFQLINVTKRTFDEALHTLRHSFGRSAA